MKELIKNYSKTPLLKQIREYSHKSDETYRSRSFGVFGHLHFIGNVSKEETVKVHILNNFTIELPVDFKDCEMIKEIEKSVRILDYKNNWDGEGSKSYKKETFINAISFLVKYTNWIWDEKVYAIPSPKILPGPNGSIDIYWKKNNFDLLVTISEHPSTTAFFYGDDKSDEIYEGRFNIKKNNPGIFLSLLTID